MKVVLQRVKEAYVEVNKDKIASISKGLLVFWGIEKGDSFQDAEVLIEKILKLRIFSDENGKMNLSIKDVDGKVLIVSQFFATTLKYEKAFVPFSGFHLCIDSYKKVVQSFFK